MKNTFFIVALSVVMLNVGAVLVHAEMSQKKGIGLAEKRGFGKERLEALNVSWYYNWSPRTNISTEAQFVPMIWSRKHLNTPIEGDYVLGYNEPDHKKQSNITVEDALESWPTLASKAEFVGSPSMAGNPVTGDWFPRFMAAGPKVDFVTVHWYKGVDPKHFIKDIEAVYTKYGKPVWVTEFAPQTTNNAKLNPNKYTQEQVDRFISETVRWMESTPWVERYAIFDPGIGTCALFDENGELTATGTTYANSQ